MNINQFKESFLKGMKENFEKYGTLVPIFFFLKDGKSGIALIPGDLLETQESKSNLIESIKNFCIDPEVECAGILHEAWATIQKPESEMTKLIMNGNMRVRDMKEKQDVICMIFATPEKEEVYSFIVDIKAKKVLDSMVLKGENQSGGGLFSNLFEYRKR